MSGVTKKLMSASGGVAGPVVAQAVDFDGTSDYLSRSTDLVGNSDGKTFTFSAWVYLDTSSGVTYVYGLGNNTFFVRFSNGGLQLLGDNPSGPATVSGYLPVGSYPQYEKTFIHVLISVDLTNTSRRHVYLNDNNVTPSITWEIYNNNAINFTEANHAVGAFSTGGNQFRGRLSNVFLDYTYRDLSVEANRRLFITDEGTPASGQASLSPILYLPMDDPADVGRNDGTGGNFTLNGIVARSGRGPNQYNSAASTFDGSADYLSTSSVTGLADGKVFTLSFCIKFDQITTAPQYVYSIGGNIFYIRMDRDEIIVYGDNAGVGAESLIASFEDEVTSPFVVGRWYCISISLDLTDISKRHFLLDGNPLAVTWTNYNNADIDFTPVGGAPYEIARDANTISNYVDGEISDFYFDTTYIDLSVDNPFYDTETDKPKFLGEFGELPTGSAPLIYLPLRADDAGNNKGTGGDFTVNSGPYVGARGPSEYWADSADFNGSNQNLSRTSALVGATDGKVLSLVFSVYYDMTGVPILVELGNGSVGFLTVGLRSGTNTMQIMLYNSAGSQIMWADRVGNIGSDNWINIAVSFDLSNTSKRHFYLGTSGAFPSLASINYNVYTNDTVPFSAANSNSLGRSPRDPNFLNGKIGFLWFNTEYIDFSQEANRLKFFDAFGFPVELGEDGSLPTGNVPLIYMNEDFHLGTNYGSGGNFTPVNAPTDGGYVKG